MLFGKTHQTPSWLRGLWQGGLWWFERALLGGVLVGSMVTGCTQFRGDAAGMLGVPQHLAPLGGVYDTTRGLVVNPHDMAQRLKHIRILFLGERHSDARTHALHLRLIRQLVTAGRKVQVALEMLPPAANPTLNAWRLGQLTQQTFLQKVRWKQHWGWSFKHYAPLFTFFRQQHLPLYGVNVTREQRRLVRQGQPLLPQLAKEIGPLSAPIHAHSTQFAQLMATASAHHGRLQPNSKRFHAFLRVQRLWEQAMGRRVAHLAKTLPPKGIVVALIGAGHVRFGLGANLHAARTSNQPQWTLLSLITPAPVGAQKGEQRIPLPVGLAQWVLVLPAQPENAATHTKNAAKTNASP